MRRLLASSLSLGLILLSLGAPASAADKQLTEP